MRKTRMSEWRASAHAGVPASAGGSSGIARNVGDGCSSYKAICRRTSLCGFYNCSWIRPRCHWISSKSSRSSSKEEQLRHPVMVVVGQKSKSRKWVGGTERESNEPITGVLDPSADWPSLVAWGGMRHYTKTQSVGRPHTKNGEIGRTKSVVNRTFGIGRSDMLISRERKSDLFID